MADKYFRKTLEFIDKNKSILESLCDDDLDINILYKTIYCLKKVGNTLPHLYEHLKIYKNILKKISSEQDKRIEREILSECVYLIEKILKKKNDKSDDTESISEEAVFDMIVTSAIKRRRKS